MLDTQLRGQLMGPNLNIGPSVGWASRGNGWDGAEADKTSHRKGAETSQGRKGGAATGAKETPQVTRELSSEPRKTQRSQERKNQAWQEPGPGCPPRMRDFKAGRVGPPSLGCTPRLGRRGRLVRPLCAEEATETRLASRHPGKTLRGGRTQLRERPDCLVDCPPPAAQNPPRVPRSNPIQSSIWWP